MKLLTAPLLVTLAVILTGCSASGSTPTAPTVAPATESSAPSTPSPTRAMSDRGNLLKQVGQGASFDNDNGKTAVTFVVNKITVDPKCTEQYAQKPKNGHFLALDVSVKSTPELAEATGSGSFSMNSAYWKAIAPNGTTFNGYLSGNSFGCIAQDKELPQSIGPAENVTGTLILDVPTTSGTLIFQPIYVKAGWEWTYPTGK